jgi:hypothetical protein
MADYLLSSNASNRPLTGQARAYRADRPRHLVADQVFPFVAPVPAKGCDFHRHFVLGHDLLLSCPVCPPGVVSLKTTLYYRNVAVM